MKVYGKDGTEYESEEQAISAGVQDYSYVKPDSSIVNATSGANSNTANKTAAVANIPTYGYELARLMSQYGVSSPVAPKTNDQSLIDQYFKKVSAPMYDQPTGNSLYNTYLGMGLGQLPNLGLPMANFYSGQPVCPEGQRYDPVTTRCVSVTDPGGVASAGRITTGTPNVGGNQCPPGFNFDPVSRSCIPTPETGLLTGGQSQSAQQPMPNCPPNTTLDPVNRICVPKGCPAGYEQDAYGNCVAKSMQTPCPPGFERDASGACLPIVRQSPCPDGKPRDYFGNCATTESPKTCPAGFEKDAFGNCVPKIDKTPCQDGYIRDAAGQCVPDPDQLAFFNKHYQSPAAGEYDIYNAINRGRLSENLVRNLVAERGKENVDQWLAMNVDPDKSFSNYAIQNLAAQGDFDDPNEANRGSQRGANRVFELYQQGAMGLGEIEQAMGKQGVQDWMRSNQPAEYNRVYGNQQPIRNVQPANAVFDTAAEQQNMAVYNQAKASGMNAQQVSAQYGIPESEISDWLNVRGLKLAKGGAVRFEDLAGKYQVGGMPTQPPMALPDDELQQMAMRYQSPAQERYDAATQSLRKTIEDMAQREEAPRGPSKAEMYFRLASAFTAPTKTGSFFENLGLAGQEMAGVASERRAAESAASQQRRDLAIELAKADVTRARDIMQMESESGLPLSPEGKSAYDEGLVPGTPEFVLRKKEIEEQNNLMRTMATQFAREKFDVGQDQLSRFEQNLLREFEQKESAARNAASKVREALKYNETAYTQSVVDQVRQAASGVFNPDDPRLVFMKIMQNELSGNALASLKATFPGAISNAEREALDKLQGALATSVQERTSILLSTLSTLLDGVESSRQGIQDVRERKYRDVNAGSSIGVPEATTEVVEEILP
jgi:hypothetical protein